MANLLNPSGRIAIIFGGAKYGPFFDHMDSIFRIPIPYRQLIFNESAMLARYRSHRNPKGYYEDSENNSNAPEAVRYSRHLDPIGVPYRYRDLTLYEITLSRFESGARKAGLRFIDININYQFLEKRLLRPFRHLSTFLTKVPVVREMAFVSGAFVLEHDR